MRCATVAYQLDGYEVADMIDRRGFIAAGALGGAVTFAAPGQAAPKLFGRADKTRFELWPTEIGSLSDLGSRYGYTTSPADVGYITVPATRKPGKASSKSYRVRFARFRGPKDASAAPVFLF